VQILAVDKKHPTTVKAAVIQEAVRIQKAHRRLATGTWSVYGPGRNFWPAERCSACVTDKNLNLDSLSTSS